MNNYMIGSDDIGADIFDDADEDEMHEAVGAALAVRASPVAQTRASPVAQTRASAPRTGSRHLSVQFEQTIQPHTEVWVSRRTGVELFKGQKVSTNTGKSFAVRRGGDLYVRALFVGQRSEIPLSINNIDNFLNGKDATSMSTVEGNTPIRFKVENTSSEPKIFRAEISGIAAGGNIDNTRAAHSRIRGDSDGAYEFGVDVLGAGPTGFQLKQPSLSLGTPSLSLGTPSASSDAPSSASYYPSNPSYLSSLNLGTPTLSMPSMSSPAPSALVSDGSWNPSVLAAPSFQVTPASQYSINGKRVTKEEFDMYTSPFWKREAFAGIPRWKVAAGAGGTLALLGLAFVAFRPRAVSGGVR